MTAAKRHAWSSAASWFVGFVTAYFCLQIVLQLLYASSLGLDEAELMVVTQSFSVGGAQPPLYDWLQILAFELLGPNLVALAVVKNLLLWAMFVFVFLAGRLVFDDDEKAALAALALFAIPQIGWESQRALAHSVLAVTVAAATLYFALRLLRSGTWPAYAAFAVCLALGTLSNRDFFLFAGALLIGGATIPGLRRGILSWRMLAAVIAAALLLVPYTRWLVDQPSASYWRIGALDLSVDVDLAIAWWRAVVAYIRGIISFVALPIVVFGLLALIPFGQRMAARPPPKVGSGGWGDARTLVLRTMWIGPALLLVLLLAARATELRYGWLQPLLFVLPLGLLILFEDRIRGARAVGLGAISIGLAIAFMIGLVVAHLFPDLRRQPPRATVPYGPIAAEIRALGFDRGYILASDSYVAGNLKLRFPESVVAEPQFGLRPTTAGDRSAQLLVAWSGKRARPPRRLALLWRDLCGADAVSSEAAVAISKTYENAGRARFRLHVVIAPMCPTPTD